MRPAVLVVLVGALALGSYAAGVAGKWTAQAPKVRAAADTPPVENLFVFRVAGNKLTGTANLNQGGEVEIRDGRIEGDKISFSISGLKGDETHAYDVRFEGKVAGDTIEFSRTTDADDYGTAPTRFTAKRIQ